MVPQAVVAHKSAERMRLKIGSRRGDRPYFERLGQAAADAFPALSVQVNAVTGSLLLAGDCIVFDDVADLGRSKALFELAPLKNAQRSMALSFTAPLHAANHQIMQLSSGRVDLPGAVFFALLVFGAAELLRGNWRTPPWYTAFWYAFGLYSKSLIDSPADALDFEGDGGD